MTDMRKFRNFTIILSYCLAIGSQIFQLCNAVTLEEEFSIEVCHHFFIYSLHLVPALQDLFRRENFHIVILYVF